MKTKPIEMPPRQELQQMLAALSDEALAYVWRPIVYAYYHTDGRDGDRLTDEDAMRMSLIGTAAHESTEFVKRVSMFATALFHTRLKRGGGC